MLSFSILFKASYIIVIIPTTLVVISALISAKEMGGSLGQGIKKISAGSIIYTILVASYLLLEKGLKGLLDDNIIRLFFMTSGLFGSFLSVWGYAQVYKIAKKLKLFTV